MRLRSSQFVVLLLIACSVQIREERALRWMEQAVSRSSVLALVPRSVTAIAGNAALSAGRTAFFRTPLQLVSAALAARREPWDMRPPASDSTSVAAHTSLLRT